MLLVRKLAFPHFPPQTKEEFPELIVPCNVAQVKDRSQKQYSKWFSRYDVLINIVAMKGNNSYLQIVSTWITLLGPQKYKLCCCFQIVYIDNIVNSLLPCVITFGPSPVAKLWVSVPGYLTSRSLWAHISFYYKWSFLLSAAAHQRMLLVPSAEPARHASW